MISVTLSQWKISILNKIDETAENLRLANNKVWSLELRLSGLKDQLQLVEELAQAKNQNYDHRSPQWHLDSFFYGHEYVWDKNLGHMQCAKFPLVPQSHYSKGGQQ